ncbi:MAG TPA: flagellar biosynthesis anti-sigma factor FlgM [Bacillota bacterium]
MMISTNQVARVLMVERAYVNLQPGLFDVEKKPDRLELSRFAQELTTAKELVLKSEEIRADNINELKKQIKEGTYYKSGAEIAGKMINRCLVDELAGR